MEVTIMQQINTAPGKDTIHPQMIKRLPTEVMKYLLKCIIGSGKRRWNSVTITTIKGGKDSKDVRSYRPVALTNILYKIFKRMTKKRLIW